MRRVPSIGISLESNGTTSFARVPPQKTGLISLARTGLAAVAKSHLSPFSFPCKSRSEKKKKKKRRPKTEGPLDRSRIWGMKQGTDIG